MVCVEKDYRRAMIGRTFDLPSDNTFAEAKERPLSPSEGKDRLQTYWDRVGLPIGGDFSAYEQVYLVG